MSIVSLACTEQGIQRVVSWDNEACKVDKEFASDIKEDQEEVDADNAKEGIDFGNGCLFLKIIESRILRKLSEYRVSNSMFPAQERL